MMWKADLASKKVVETTMEKKVGLRGKREDGR
jgi:hypothetical protein